MELLLAIHAFATLSMTGLIWFVQIVHYPLMARVGESGFTTYEHEHMKRTLPVVATFMGAEFATSILLWVRIPGVWTTAGLILVGLVMAVTAFLSVPCHQKLSAGYDAAVLRRLVGTNWIRTVGWTARGVIAVMLF